MTFLVSFEYCPVVKEEVAGSRMGSLRFPSDVMM